MITNSSGTAGASPLIRSSINRAACVDSNVMRSPPSSASISPRPVAANTDPARITTHTPRVSHGCLAVVRASLLCTECPQHFLFPSCAAGVYPPQPDVVCLLQLHDLEEEEQPVASLRCPQASSSRLCRLVQNIEANRPVPKTISTTGQTH